MVWWSPSLLAAPRLCGPNPAQGFFVGFILCLCNYVSVLKNNKQKIHPNGMATFIQKLVYSIN